MSTNYYIVKKATSDLDNRVRKATNEIDFISLEEDVKTFILDKYKNVFNEFKDDSTYVERFKSSLENSVNQFIYDLRLQVNENLFINYDELKHIGKSSMGWLFLFKYQKEWKNYEELKSYLLENLEKNEEIIIDEYGEEISVEDFINLVENKQNDKECQNNPDNFKYNDNVDGYRFSDGIFS